MLYWAKQFIYSTCRTLVGCSLQLVRAFKKVHYIDDVNDFSDAEDKESNLYKWRHWGPISAAIVTMMIGIIASILHVSWWEITTLGGFADFLLFLTWNYLVLKNLNDSSRLGAGFIKLGWHPTYAEYWPLLNYCHRCMCFKLPRAHHCSKCGRCVQLMDHHCPWINGCVGKRNRYKFIRFLTLAIAGCIHASIIITNCLYEVVIFILYTPVRNLSGNGMHRSHSLYNTHELPIDSIFLFIFSILAVGMAYGVILALSVLLFMQLRSLHLDQTGIETLRAATIKGDEEEKIENEEEKKLL